MVSRSFKIWAPKLLATLWYWVQSLLPHKLLSRCVGWVADLGFGPTLAKLWAKIFNIDISQSELPEFEDYPTLNRFFTRSVKLDLPELIDGIASPCDGTLGMYGDVADCNLLQIKDQSFSLAELFGPAGGSEHFEQGSYANFYLAPKDYHWVHNTCSGRLEQIERIPGRLYSVNQLSVAGVPRLFARNERILFLLDTPQMGQVAIFMVGALIVGGIEASTEAQQAHEVESLLPQYAPLGKFYIGSSVVVVSSKRVQWSQELEYGMSVKVGQTLTATS